jgi:hypothetical protein
MGNHSSGSTDNRNGGEPPPCTPYLYIRYDEADIGARPLAQGTVFYASPDIWATPTDKYGNPQEGAEVTVHARVLNRGMAPAFAVNVEFYWFNPALAITPGNGHPIGSALVTVPAGNYVKVPCPTPWKPTSVNAGHQCLFVQCSCPEDPLTAPFSPALDRHVGQRNITVAWSHVAHMLQLSASNPFDSELPFRLQLSTLLVQARLKGGAEKGSPELMGLLANLHSPGRVPTKAEQQLRLRVQEVTDQDLGVRVVHMKQAELPQTNEERPELGRYIQHRAMRRPDFRPETLGRVLGEFSLPPGLMNVVDIEVPTVELKPGQFIVHRVSQVAAGCDIGGYTIIIPSA